MIRLLPIFITIFFCSNAFASGPKELHTTDSLTAQLPELSVTAIKQAPALDLQPIAATTITSSEVERQRIITMKQASEIVPNFYVPDYGSRMTSTIYVRGLGARIDQPAVGLNIDNVPVLNKNDYDIDLFNIERIEVLRGPQSVLYGRNTMGGLINIYTLSPLRYQGIRLIGEYGTGNSWRAGAGIYGLIRDGLGMSLSINASGTDGFWHNDTNGSEVGRGHQASVRWKTAYAPADSRFTLENIVSFNLNREHGYPYEWLETGCVAYNDTCYYKRTSIMEGLTMQWKADGFTVSSITGLRYMDDDMTLDQDFTPKSYFTLTQATREWAVTQDVIFRGHKGDYTWMAGAFGFLKHAKMNAPVNFLSDGIQELIIDNAMSKMPAGMTLTWNDASFLLGSRFTIPVYGAAIYHESAWSHGPWKLTGALRLDYEHTGLRSRSFTDTSCTVTMYGLPIKREVNIDDHNVFGKHFLQLLPRITATYRLPMPTPSTVYASIAKGYKSGGYNTQMFSDVLQQQMMAQMMPSSAELPSINDVVGYKPEQSWNYEIGGHIACADGRIHTDMALFYIDCRDQQLTCFPDAKGTGRMMTNAARTCSMGLEASINARPDKHVELIATYGFTDARFINYDNGKEDYSGKFIPYAPRHTLFGSITYRQPLRASWIDGVSLTVDGRGIGPIYWDESNVHSQKLYGLLGLSIKLDHRHYSLDIWGENILNTRFSTFYFESIGHSFVQRGKPRRLGMTVHINI